MCVSVFFLKFSSNIIFLRREILNILFLQRTETLETFSSTSLIDKKVTREDKNNISSIIQCECVRFPSFFCFTIVIIHLINNISLNISFSQWHIIITYRLNVCFCVMKGKELFLSSMNVIALKILLNLELHNNFNKSLSHMRNKWGDTRKRTWFSYTLKGFFIYFVNIFCFILF